jgi:microcystin-dependent protein
VSTLTPEGAPLTPEEQKLVTRLFSDPFYFPLQFKTWLQWFIEGVEGNVAGGTSAGGPAPLTGVPIGGVIFIGGTVLPANCLWTDGAAYSRTTYVDLFREIGTQFGAGDGSTTFNVPDVQGRTLVGKGPNAAVNAVGKNEGLAAANRRMEHRHSTQESPHTHPPTSGTFNFSDSPPGDRTWSATGGGSDRQAYTTGPATTGLTVGSGVATDALDKIPFLVLNGIIRYV